MSVVTEQSINTKQIYDEWWECVKSLESSYKQPSESSQYESVSSWEDYSELWALSRLKFTWPELVWEWDPILWLLSSLLTLSRVGTLPLDLMDLMVPIVPVPPSFSSEPNTSPSRCSEEAPDGLPFTDYYLPSQIWHQLILSSPEHWESDHRR